MSVPSYIINWEELLDIIGDNFDVLIDDIDLGELGEYLKENMELIIDLLTEILELLKDKGVQKVESISNHIPAIVAPFKFSTTFDRDILLTGITYSQSAWKYQDSWDLLVGGNLLYNNVGTKEIGESKNMNVFYYVPSGTSIDIIFHNDSGNSRLVWFDIEYIDLSLSNYIPSSKGSIVINYITKDNKLVYSDVLEGLSLGSHKILPNDIEGYDLVGPTNHNVVLTNSSSVKTVDFIVERNLPEVDTDFDWVVFLYWEDDTNTDLDIYALVDGEHKVYYNNKIYKVDDRNQVYLNQDYRSHGVNGRYDEVEVLTILGMKDSVVNIIVNNYNSGSLIEDVQVSIYKKTNMGLDLVRDIIIPSYEISNNGKDIELGTIKNDNFYPKYLR